MGSRWLMRRCLQPRNANGRFLFDTFFSPTIYYQIFDSPSIGLKTVRDMENAIVPVLHPLSKSRPVPLHKVPDNIRFRAWVRLAYMRNKLAHHPSVGTAEEKFGSDLTTVPSIAELNDLFGLHDWDRHPSIREDEIQRGLIKAYENDDVESMKEWGLEELLESVGCCIVGTNAFNMFCERNFVYEFLTRDYVEALCNYLAQRFENVIRKVSDDSDEFRILEVGCGTGQLSFLVEQGLEKRLGRRVKIQVTATDTGIWVARHRERKRPSIFPNVKRMDYKLALKEYRPHVVMCSWMPMNIDWSADFRNTPSVLEYILIGETDNGCCGHPWQTWGHSIDRDEALFTKQKEMTKKSSYVDIFHWMGSSADQQANEVVKRQDSLPTPPYQKEGFSRQNLPFSDLQLSRYDRKHYAANSHTVSFRRDI